MATELKPCYAQPMKQKVKAKERDFSAEELDIYVYYDHVVGGMVLRFPYACPHCDEALFGYEAYCPGCTTELDFTDEVYRWKR